MDRASAEPDVAFEAATMYVCAVSYRPGARQRLSAPLLPYGGSGMADPALASIPGRPDVPGDHRAGVTVAEFAHRSQAELFRSWVDDRGDAEMWVAVGVRPGRPRERTYRVVAEADLRSHTLTRLRLAWRDGSASLLDTGPARPGRSVTASTAPPADVLTAGRRVYATRFWQGILAVATPVRTPRGLCLGLPVGQLSNMAVEAARLLSITTGVRHTRQFSVMTIASDAQILSLLRLVPHQEAVHG